MSDTTHPPAHRLPEASRECSSFCRCPSAQALVPERPAPRPCPQEASASFHTSLSHEKQKTQSCPLQAQPMHSRPDPILGPAEPQPCPLESQHKLWGTPDPGPNCIRNQRKAPTPTPIPNQCNTSSGIPGSCNELQLFLPTGQH